jgi:hypothetical protein
MYFIIDGDVEVISETGNVIVSMHAGTPFGELALLNSTPSVRSAHIRAATDVSLAILSLTDFKFIMQHYPDFAHKVRKQARERMKENVLKTGDTDRRNSILSNSSSSGSDADMPAPPHQHEPRVTPSQASNEIIDRGDCKPSTPVNTNSLNKSGATINRSMDSLSKDASDDSFLLVHTSVPLDHLIEMRMRSTYSQKVCKKLNEKIKVFKKW